MSDREKMILRKAGASAANARARQAIILARKKDNDKAALAAL
jgi:hypothetical protein